MLLWREKIPADWLPKVLSHLPEVLIDHAHLERKAATTALNLEKYRDLYPRVDDLNAIAIEELQHFQLVLNLLQQRGIPFGQPTPSPWISGLMRSVRNGQRHQVIDHLHARRKAILRLERGRPPDHAPLRFRQPAQVELAEHVALDDLVRPEGPQGEGFRMGWDACQEGEQGEDSDFDHD